MLHSCKRFSWLRTVSLKNAQHGSCKLNFMWGQSVQETAPQIALRNCSKEAGKVSTYMILVKGEYMQSTYFLQISASHEEQSSP